MMMMVVKLIIYDWPLLFAYVLGSKFVGAPLTRIELGQRCDELTQLLLFLSRRVVGYGGGDGVKQCPAMSTEHISLHGTIKVLPRSLASRCCRG